MTLRIGPAFFAASMLAAFTSTSASSAADATPLRPASERFTPEDAGEVPDFQRHVLPMMGRVGCNTRSCHGSFQGQGGLRLSLFGYDFAADRDTLLKGGTDRVVLDDPDGSKIISKATLSQPHKGGQRFELGSWQHHLLVRWIEGGAKGVEAHTNKFERLEVTPEEILFDRNLASVPIKVVAVWEDGSREDVTCLTRFRTNDESIATISEGGVVSSVGPGDTHVVAFYDNGVAPIAVLRPVSNLVGARYPESSPRTRVDELVVSKLQKLGIVASPVCTDAEFLRRVSLDLTGTLPTPAEVKLFLAEKSSTKRSQKIDELLGRPTYATWWSTKLCDYTGAAPQTLNVQQWGDQAPRQWYDWIYKRVAANVPYDQIVAGIVEGVSREGGQSYEDYLKRQARENRKDPAPTFADRETMPHYWARTNFRKPEERVIGISYSFLGIRLECAQCHKHPFDQWTQDDFNRFGSFFASIGVGVSPEGRELTKKLNEDLGLDKLMGNDKQRELNKLRAEGKEVPWQEVYINANNRPARTQGAKKGGPVPSGRVVSAKVLGGEEVELDGKSDPRTRLVEWLRGADNPYFARAFVNRVWAHDFGVGIVNPPDDMNLANPPSNGPLLEYLAEGFVAHHFDMKWLHREILNSDAYQRSWKVEPTNALDERNFSHALVRRLPAEVLIDAVHQSTGNNKLLAMAATDIDDRAIGVRVRGGKGANASTYAGKVFGASTRETNCDCNRSDEPNLLQSIYLQNDNDIFAAIDRADGWVAERTKAAADIPDDELDDDGPSLAILHQRLRVARAANQPARVERLQTRIASLERQAGGKKGEKAQEKAKEKAREKADAQVAAAPAVPLRRKDGPAVIREAYLRTLGRDPTAAEVKDVMAYIEKSADSTRGLRDLLWTLLNTKEFATNH